MAFGILSDELGRAFRKVVALVQSCEDPCSCWTQVLDFAGQASNSELTSADIQSDIRSVAKQLECILATAPMPPDTSFVYFGFFDRVVEGKEQAGYYISGWTGEHSDERLAEGGDPHYFPENRHLTSPLLNSIKAFAASKSSGSHDAVQALEYAVTFGAASIISKFAASSVGLSLPVYVGFDSGDFARVG